MDSLSPAVFYSFLCVLATSYTFGEDTKFNKGTEFIFSLNNFADFSITVEKKQLLFMVLIIYSNMYL